MYDGFITSFDFVRKVYGVKYNDGDFSENIWAEEIKLRKPVELKSPGVWDENGAKLTAQATAIIKEIFHRYSENGVVEIGFGLQQEMRFMSLTKFKLFLSDFVAERNQWAIRLTNIYYKYATGIASNDVPALLEDGFIKHYTEQARTGNEHVWYDIFTMGYDATLQLVKNNIIRNGEVVRYRKSEECDFEDAVVLNEWSTDFQIMLLKSGAKVNVAKPHQTIRKYYNKCHKCREILKQASLHSFCCCVECEQPRPDGSAIQSIAIWIKK